MTVCMFPGQGSQSKGMGAELFDLFPELTAKASEILGYPIRKLCLEDPQRQLNNTRYTQPALYVVSALAYRKRLRDGAARPGYFIGHSLGEYNALEAAGAVSFEDGLRLVNRRGELMAGAPPGAMAAVIGLTEAQLRAQLSQHGLDTVDVANLNGFRQLILSGLKEDIAAASTRFDGQEGVRFVQLNTSGAFHSRYMAPARQAFDDFLQGISFAEPEVPVIANVDAAPYAFGQIRQNLSRQITHPVQWTRSIEWLLGHGETQFEEVGPGQVLAKLVAEIRKQAEVQIVVPAAPRAEPAPRLSGSALAARIAQFNREVSVGTPVKAAGYDAAIRTRTQAMVLFGHRAAIYLEGYLGYFDLDDIRHSPAA